MNILYLITSILFLIWAFRNVLFWVHLWQLKEYRIDRTLTHLKETKQGKNLLFSPLAIIKWAAFFLYGAVILYDIPYVVFPLAVYGIFIAEVFIVFKEYFSHFLKRPIFTLKALSIVLFISLAVAVLMFLPLSTDKFLWLLFLDKIVPLGIAFIVLFLSYPTEFYRDIQIEKAIKKLRRHKKIPVIAVTGSYGKSSTKDYIAQILEKKFNVLKTKGTNNTPIGVANTIVSGLRDNTEIFVVEMGAYKKGEIKEMCEMVKPTIGVLTAVSPQHLSLFGSLEKTIETKYELIESLPKDGLAMFNANNKIVRKLYMRPKVKKVIYGSRSSDSPLPASLTLDIEAQDIILHKNSFSFNVVLQGKILHLSASLIGGHNIENILPGIFLARYLGMSDNTIKNTVAHLTSLSNTMIRHESKGITYIDDTFNTSPDAVLAAVNYMKIYKGKKILVLQPMIELGKEAHTEHKRVGYEIGKICDYVFLTNKNFFHEVSEGITANKSSCKAAVSSIQDIVSFVIKNAKKGDIIVFEGKEASISFNKIL